MTLSKSEILLFFFTAPLTTLNLGGSPREEVRTQKPLFLKNGCCKALAVVGLLQGSQEQSNEIKLKASSLANGKTWTD